MGMQPSPEFKKILDAINELQLDGKVADLESAVAEAKDLLTN